MQPMIPSGLYYDQVRTGLGIEMIGIQHHEAHLASCLAENNYSETCWGLFVTGQDMGKMEQFGAFEFFSR